MKHTTHPSFFVDFNNEEKVTRVELAELNVDASVNGDSVDLSQPLSPNSRHVARSRRIPSVDTYGQQLLSNQMVDLCLPLKAIEDAFVANRSLTSVDLSINKVGPEGARILSIMMKPPHQVERLDLRINNIGEDGCMHIANALVFAESLIFLDLSSNSIGTQGALALGSALLENKTLQTLNMSGNNIQEDGCVNIATAAQSHPKLSNLSLGSNSLTGICLAEGIRMSRSLVELHISDNKLGEKYTSHLLFALQDNLYSKLAVLNLHGNGMGDEGARAVAAALRSKKCTLEVLNLGGNKISNIGACAVAEALRTCNTSLVCLDLSSNELTDLTAMAFAGMLMNNKSLRRLYLHHNEITNEGAFAIGEVLEVSPRLDIVCINDDIPVDQFRDKAVFSIDLSMQTYDLCDFVVLSRILRTNTWLTEIDFGPQQVTETAIVLLQSALLSNSVLAGQLRVSGEHIPLLFGVKLKMMQIQRSLEPYLGAIQLAVDFFQMVSFSFSIELPWSSEGSSFANVMKGLQLDINISFLVRFIVMASCVLMVLLLLVPIKGQIPIQRLETHGSRLFPVVWTIFWAAGTVLFLPVNRTFFATLDCSMSTDSQFLLDQDPTVVCWTGIHLVLAIIAIILYIPYFLLVLRLAGVGGSIERCYSDSKERFRWTRWSLDEPDLEDRHVFSLQSVYSSQAYVVAKAILMAGTIFFTQYSMVIVIVFIIGALSQLVITAMHPPYYNVNTNRLKFGLVLGVLFTNGIGLLVYLRQDFPDTNKLLTFIFLAGIIPVILLGVIIAKWLIKKMEKPRQKYIPGNLDLGMGNDSPLPRSPRADVTRSQRKLGLVRKPNPVLELPRVKAAAGDEKIAIWHKNPLCDVQV